MSCKYILWDKCSKKSENKKIDLWQNDKKIHIHKDFLTQAKWLDIQKIFSSAKIF